MVLGSKWQTRDVICRFHAHNIVLTLYLFITQAIEKIILEMTNLEGFHKYGVSWKKMDETDQHAYWGLLILADACRSQGEAATRMQRLEGQLSVPRCTEVTICKTGTIFLSEVRNTHITDKPPAIREGWDKCVSSLCNPLPDVWATSYLQKVCSYTLPLHVLISYEVVFFASHVHIFVLYNFLYCSLAKTKKIKDTDSSWKNAFHTPFCT